MAGGRLTRELCGMWRSVQYDMIRVVRRLRHSRLRHLPVVIGVLAAITVGGAGVTAAAFHLRPDTPAPPIGSSTTLPPMKSPTATAFVTLTAPPTGIPTTITATETATAHSTHWQTSEIHLPGPTYLKIKPGPTVTATATATATATMTGPTVYITTTPTPSLSPSSTTSPDDPPSGNAG